MPDWAITLSVFIGLSTLLFMSFKLREIACILERDSSR
jgi:hypothetical protein